MGLSPFNLTTTTRVRGCKWSHSHGCWEGVNLHRKLL